MGARIPTYDEQPTQTGGYHPPGAELQSTNLGSDVSRGLEQVGQATEYAGKQADEAAKAAKAKAYAISQANADAAYQRAETQHLVGGSNRGQLIDAAFNEQPGADNVTSADVVDKPGYLSSRGIEAQKLAGPTLDELEQKRQQIAKDTFADEEQRQLWLAKSQSMLEASHHRIESHAAQQVEVAAQDALKGKLSTTLQAIADDTNGAHTADLMASAEQSIRALQTTPAGGDAAVLKLQHEAVKVRIERLVADGNVDVAERQLEVARKSGAGLGTDGPEIERLVNHAREAQNIGKAKIAGATAADAEIQKAVDPKSGWVDAAKANAAIAKLPPGPVKDHALEYAKSEIALLEKAKAEAVHQHFASALSALETSNGNLGAVSNQDAQFLQNKLNKLDGEETWQKVLAVADRYKARFREATKAHAEHETPAQAQALVELEADIAKNPEVYKGMSKEQFDYQWADRLSVGGYKSGGAKYATAQKDNPEKAAEFSRYVKDSIVQSPGLAVSKVKAALYAAEMGRLRQEYVSDSKGKEPDAEARKKMEASATVTALLWKPGTPSRPVDIVSPTSSNFLRPPAEKAAAPKKVRIRNTAGRLGWWDGVSPLPQGATVVTGG